MRKRIGLAALGVVAAGVAARRATARTGTADALVDVCVQDLYAGKLLLAKRLPALARAATDERLRTLLTDGARAAGVQAGRLRATGVATGGPRNIWMAGVLDDARRDTRSIVPGRLLDVALIGAVRKARAAEIVSNDTAIVLATACGRVAVAEAARANQREERDDDAALADVLAALAGK